LSGAISSFGAQSFGLSSQVPWKQNLAGDCPVVKLNVVSGPSGMFSLAISGFLVIFKPVPSEITKNSGAMLQLLWSDMFMRVSESDFGHVSPLIDLLVIAKEEPPVVYWSGNCFPFVYTYTVSIRYTQYDWSFSYYLSAFFHK